MKKLFSLVFALVIIIAGEGILSVSADESDHTAVVPNPPAVVKTGDYKELTWYRQLKLGTAPYVNPKLLKHISVAYVYPSGSLSNVDEAKLNSLKDDGIIVRAVHSDGLWKISDAIHAGSRSEDGSIVWVSTLKAYEDVEPVKTLVTWNAGPPITDQ